MRAFFLLKTHKMLSKEQIKILNQEKSIEALRKREERYTYLGLLQTYQIQPKELVQKLEYTKLNSRQHFLFKRVLHGLNMYSKQEISKMHKDKKRRIKKVWMKGQTVINEWKQIISSKKVNAYLYHMFGDNVKGIIEVPVTDILPNYRNNISLKDLGIKYEDLILKFISVGLLPKNFLSIKA